MSSHHDPIGNGAALRHHFTRAREVSPQQYRRTFAAQSVPAASAWQVSRYAE